ncbi:hypothetical protein AtNW77_Chr1g0049681 [Arabidopsis thaliana]
MSQYAEECGSELSSIIKPISKLSKGVSIVKNVFDIVLVISECFLRKKKIRCKKSLPKSIIMN